MNMKPAEFYKNTGPESEARNAIVNYNRFSDEYFEYLSNYKDFEGDSADLDAMITKNFIAVDYDSHGLTGHVLMAEELPGSTKKFYLGADGSYSLWDSSDD